MSFTVHDAQIRVDNCDDCKDPCEAQKAGKIDHSDPCAACPRRIWHAWGNCAAAARVEIPAAAPTRPPSVVRQAATGVTSFTRWVAAGRPKTPADALAMREGKCRACVDWDAKGFAGLGRCRRCGCSGIKLTWATEACPKGEWAAVAPVTNPAPASNPK